MGHHHMAAQPLQDSYWNASTSQTALVPKGGMLEIDEDEGDDEKEECEHKRDEGGGGGGGGGRGAEEQQHQAVEQEEEREDSDQEDTEAQIRARKKNRLKFWLTAIFMTMGSVCFSAFLFLIPFQIDPAISAILADFHPEETLCSVVSAEVFVGISSCAWTSCSEGCTRDLYKCFQIKVNYTAAPGGTPACGGGEEEATLQPQTAPTSSSSSFTGFLFVNVRGCGYPPDVSCESFFQKYGRSKDPFPCFYSKRNSSVVITSFRKEDEIRTIIVSCIPILGILISSIGIAIVPRKEKKSSSSSSFVRRKKKKKKESGGAVSTTFTREEPWAPSTRSVKSPERASHLRQQIPSAETDLIPFGDFLPPSQRQHPRTSGLFSPPPSSTNSPRSPSRSFSSTSSSPSISFVLRNNGSSSDFSTTPAVLFGNRSSRPSNCYPSLKTSLSQNNHYLLDTTMEETVLDAAVLKRKIYVTEAPTLKKRVRHM